MSPSRKASSYRKTSNHRKLDKIIHINNNNFHFPINNQIYNKSKINFENTVNKYSIKLFEKLNFNNTHHNKNIKLFDTNINNNFYLNSQNLRDSKNSKELKTIALNKNKDKEKIDINNINATNKINKNLSSFNSNNSIYNQKNQIESYYRKYSDSVKKKNNESNKLKNIKVSRNISNAMNFLPIDIKKNDNYNEDINNSNIVKNKNASNIKFMIDLTNHTNNNINKNNINKTINLENCNTISIDSNTFATINSYNNKEINLNNNNNNLIEKEKEKKFSIIDIPAPLNDNNNNNNIIININDNKENNEEKTINNFKNLNLTKREKAYYLLIKSPIIPLRSQLILSRSTNNIKKIISTKEIVKNYEIHLNDKINDYKNKIITYNQKITSIFTSSKIAEISLNFITSNNENEFSDIYNSLIYTESDINYIYYKTYIKILYYVMNENFEETKKDDSNADKKLLINLYTILNKKNYKTIKDYLYFLFISNDNKKRDNCFMKNIDIINELINNEEPKLLDICESTKMCKFIRFSIYLIKEIIDFGNIVKNTTKLKIETESFIELLKSNLDKFRHQYNIK